MSGEPEKVEVAPVSPDRLWAEQLAIGLSLLMGLLVFMAFAHQELLTAGAKVLTTNDLAAYGWAAVLGVFLQLVIHELATFGVAWWLKLPLHWRLFPFGANATAVLQELPRDVWRDARVGFAGPVTGALFSFAMAGIYQLSGNPLFLCIACVGYFYHLFTLIPILDLEGGWIAPAIGPQFWLFGIAAMGLELTKGFNLVLLCVFCFAVPRLLLIIRARAPRLDVGAPQQLWLAVNLVYFILVLALAWFGSTTFDALPKIIRDSMGD